MEKTRKQTYQRQIRAKVDHVTDCVFLPAHAISRAGYTQFLRWSDWEWSMQGRLSARIMSGFHCVCFAPGGGGGELSLRREFSPASSQHLPRCRWGGAVAVLADGLDGKIKKGDPLSSSFPPIRSSARFLRSEARPAVLPPRERARRSVCLFPRRKTGRMSMNFQNVRLHKRVVNE